MTRQFVGVLIARSCSRRAVFGYNLSMRAQEFFKAVTMDEANLLERFIALLDEHHISYCVIGGQAVNAYAEPLVSLDLDLVIAPDDLSALDSLLTESFTVKRFPHSLN